jgi:hypothetical protein
MDNIVKSITILLFECIQRLLERDIIGHKIGNVIEQHGHQVAKETPLGFDPWEHNQGI